MTSPAHARLATWVADRSVRSKILTAVASLAVVAVAV